VIGRLKRRGVGGYKWRRKCKRRKECERCLEEKLHFGRLLKVDG
jgi:hypothetical protein